MQKKALFDAFCIIFILCCFGISGARAQAFLAQRYDFSLAGETLPAALLQLSRTSGVTIGFSDAQLEKQSRTLQLSLQQEKLSTILDRLLEGSGLVWSAHKGQVVIARLVLPERIISGYVEDAENGERLVGATVYELSAGRRVMTNEYGFFSFQVTSGVAIPLKAAMLGYETAGLNLAAKKSNLQVTLLLRPADPLREVVISADSSGSTQGILLEKKNDYARLPIEKMPALGGETDLMRAIAAVAPGVSSGSDGFGGLAVRGGETDHNLILLDDATIFYPNHGLGLFSIINPDIVRSATFWKGDAPAQLSSRIGSVLDVRTREGNLFKPAASASVGWIAARLTMELPLVKEKVAMLVSARRSLLSPLIRHFTEKNKKKDDKTGQSDYHFADLNLKLNWIINQNDRVYWSGYAGTDSYADRDSFVYKLPLPLSSFGATDYRWKNLSGAFRWNHVWSDKCFSNTTLTASKFHLRSVAANWYNLLGTTINIASVSQSDLAEWTAKTDWDWFLHEGNLLKAGASISRQVLKPIHLDAMAQVDTLDVVEGNGQIKPNKGHTLAVYASEEWTPAGKGLQLKAGLRAELFLSEGDHRRFALQPRFSAEKKLWQNVALNLSICRSVQPMRSVAPNGLETMGDFWLLSTREIPLQSAWQSALGAVWTVDGWSARAAFFYKSLDGLDEYRKPEVTDSLIYSDGRQPWQHNLTFGRGQSAGLELSLQLTRGKTRGWFAYTLSNATRTFKTLNGAQPFAARFGRLHDLKLALTQDIGRHFSLSANWLLSSGDAVSTLVFQESIGKIRFLDLQQLADQAQRTGYGDLRQPWMHRLDVAANWQWTKRRLTQRVSISLYNAYNRSNRYFTFLVLPVISIGQPTAVVNTVNGLPFLPSLTWVGTF